MEYKHVSVLLAEVLHYLNCSEGSTVVDCTLDGAGHAEAVAELIAPNGLLVGIELDIVAIDAAKRTLARFGQQIKIVRDNFKNIDNILKRLGVRQVDAFLFDLGVSSYQLDTPERGFSFRLDGPLDMRMDPNAELTAAEVVNFYPEKKLAEVIQRYGEEPWAKRIARFIVETRGRKPIKSTVELTETIKQAIPASVRRKGGHPARKTFQALRIEVNQELENLAKTLEDCIKWLKPGGRLVVISYHSLEDRIVKESFKKSATGCICPPSLPVCRCGRQPVAHIVTKKPIRPSEEEIARNPRADSAKLRVLEKF